MISPAARQFADLLAGFEPEYRKARVFFCAEIIRLALKAENNNRCRAARRLGITRSQIHRKLAETAVELPAEIRAAIEGMAIVVFADVNSNLQQAKRVFDRALADAAVDRAPRRSWVQAGLKQLPHFISAAAMLHCHRNTLLRCRQIET